MGRGSKTARAQRPRDAAGREVAFDRRDEVRTDERGRLDLPIRTSLAEMQQHQRPPRRRIAPINRQTGLAFGRRKTKIAVHGLASEERGLSTPTILTPSHPFLPDQLEQRYAHREELFRINRTFRLLIGCNTSCRIRTLQSIPGLLKASQCQKIGGDSLQTAH